MMSLTEVMATSKLSRSVAALMNALALAEAWLEKHPNNAFLFFRTL